MLISRVFERPRPSPARAPTVAGCGVDRTLRPRLFCGGRVHLSCEKLDIFEMDAAIVEGAVVACRQEHTSAARSGPHLALHLPQEYITKHARIQIVKARRIQGRFSRIHLGNE